MKTAKKIISALFVLLFILCTAGCGAREVKPMTSGQFDEKWKVTPTAKKVIMDTDLKYFFDDVYALYALLQADRLGYIDLVGITACSGNTFTAGVAYDTLALLEYFGRTDIPLYLGTDEPVGGYIDIVQAKKESGIPAFSGCYDHLEHYTYDYKKAHENGFATWEGEAPKTAPEKQEASDFIIGKVHEYPGEVTILALGGLTNIAHVLQKDPSVTADAAGIVYMGGVFDTWGEGQKSEEFNFWFDPAAANISLNADWKTQTIISHDAATTCLKDYNVYLKALNKNHNPLTKLFTEYCEKDCETADDIKQKMNSGTPFCWDPITVAFILKPEICTVTEKRYVWIDERSGRTFGSTFNWKDGAQPEGVPCVDVVLAVDGDGFWDFMLDLYDVK